MSRRTRRWATQSRFYGSSWDRFALFGTVPRKKRKMRFIEERMEGEEGDEKPRGCRITRGRK